ncbi:MAG TPA: SH3 domain-containing protein [Nitrosomonas sp.]|nr:SH3 domain-containing protein [Nitrosomonas sp.]HMV12170.1 SH3 domain-containing protein [Nitrosomonas sp.]HMW21335.1 SH3 domain-containing protein [Nitrosomonas sp.]HMW68883.1 SH3 domain-containing protein [Nitrosomonas sp.]HMY60694.1 SH3 domain-containing protein [Nitrosomonas sp.]
MCNNHRNLTLILRFFWIVLFSLHASISIAADENEFLSISSNSAIMYDAPSLKAEKLFIVNAYFPVQVLVKVEGWTKVKDSSDTIAWIENKFLTERRYVIVTAPLANIHQSADIHSPILFQVQKDVVIELLDSSTTDWVQIRLQNGQMGYIRSNQIWGS